MMKTVKKFSRFIAVPMILVMLAAGCAFASPMPGGRGEQGGHGEPAMSQPMNGGGHNFGGRGRDMERGHSERREPEPRRDCGRRGSSDSGLGTAAAVLLGGLLIGAIANSSN